MRNAGLDEYKLESILPGEISITSDTWWHYPYGRRQRTEEPLGEKVGLKLNIQKTKIMASGPITSWQRDGETMERDFLRGGSKITADGDCSHEIKTLAPWKKSYDQPKQHIKKQTLLCNKGVCLVKAMVFPVMYGCESWTKESWAPKNWCFWTVVLEKTLESLGLQDQTSPS